MIQLVYSLGMVNIGNDSRHFRTALKEGSTEEAQRYAAKLIQVHWRNHVILNRIADKREIRIGIFQQLSALSIQRKWRIKAAKNKLHLLRLARNASIQWKAALLLQVPKITR